MENRLLIMCFATYAKWVLVPSIASALLTTPASAQAIDEDKIGAWYIYAFNYDAKESRWGAQGDIQYRNWDTIGDLEQLLIRGGLTYRPESLPGKYTLGYANITSGTFGSSSRTLREDRVYQEALFPHRLGERVYVRHRLRYEQRWVDYQDFRTRIRYGLIVDIPFNKTTLEKGAWYLSLYNEIFLNGEHDIGLDKRVDTYDRNRFYAAIGYSLSDSTKFQFGLMHQHSKNVEKSQWQLSLIQNF
jgi:hypothetical protein